MPEQRIARLTANPEVVVPFRVTAHVSGNNIDVLHCPFCGSGAIVARSDGSIECQFCESAYTVQVQPMYAAFPGTVDGSPYMWPGRPQGDNMPGAMGPDSMDPEALAGGAPGAEDAADAAQGFAEGADPAAGGPPAGDDDSGGGNPFAKGGDDSGDDDDDSGKAKVKGKDAPPFTKKKSSRLGLMSPTAEDVLFPRTFRTATGAVVSTEDFLRHLAITTASDQMTMIKRVKASRDRG